MAPLSVPPATPRGEGGVQRREANKGEKRRWGHQPPADVVLLFLERRDLLGADQRRAAAALPAGVVGAGAVFVVRSLWELVDGR